MAWTDTSHEFCQLPDLKLHTYNCWDTHNTAHLLKVFLQQGTNPLLAPNFAYYRERLAPLQKAVVNMSRRGLLVDRPRLDSYRTEVTRELRETDDAIRAYADATGFSYGPKFPNSKHQVSAFLFKHLGFKPPKTTDTGYASVDTESLDKVLKGFRKKDEPHREVLYNLFHRSRLQTLKTRYLTLDIHNDGRVRARVKMTGTKTWRFAYDEPPLQQFPPECQPFFVAAKGKVFVCIDKKQFEARILANLSGDEPMLEAFARGEDIHTVGALDFFGYSPEQWAALSDTARKGSRNASKSAIFGVAMYGGAAESVKLKIFCPHPKCMAKMPPTIELSRTLLKQSMDRWHLKHPAVGRFQQQLAQFIRERHYYETPFGWRRFIGKPWGPELERESKNIPMQTGAALMMHDMQVRLDQAGFPIVLQRHDEFMFEMEDDAHLHQRIADAQGIMEAPVAEMGGVVFPTSVAVGYNWGPYDKDTNPDGRREL